MGSMPLLTTEHRAGEPAAAHLRVAGHAEPKDLAGAGGGRVAPMTLAAHVRRAVRRMGGWTILS